MYVLKVESRFQDSVLKIILKLFLVLQHIYGILKVFMYFCVYIIPVAIFGVTFLYSEVNRNLIF